MRQGSRWLSVVNYMLVVLLKVPMIIGCTQVDLPGRAQGLRLMSVAMLWKLLPLPGPTHLGTVLDLP